MLTVHYDLMCFFGSTNVWKADGEQELNMDEERAADLEVTIQDAPRNTTYEVCQN